MSDGSLQLTETTQWQNQNQSQIQPESDRTGASTAAPSITADSQSRSSIGPSGGTYSVIIQDSLLFVFAHSPWICFLVMSSSSSPSLLFGEFVDVMNIMIKRRNRKYHSSFLCCPYHAVSWSVVQVTWYRWYSNHIAANHPSLVCQGEENQPWTWDTSQSVDCTLNHIVQYCPCPGPHHRESVINWALFQSISIIHQWVNGVSSVPQAPLQTVNGVADLFSLTHTSVCALVTLSCLTSTF